MNRLVSALHRRRANGMTAYEAFGRVVADRDRLPDVGLSWPVGTVHTPGQIAQMQDLCSDIRTALQAIGNPSTHPLQGIEQTRWNPAWVQTLQQTIDRVQVTLQQMRVAADALVTSLGLNEIADDSLLPQVVKLVALMLNANAADGVLLLNEDGPARIRSLLAMAEIAGRIDEKTSELSTGYDVKAVQLDLPALQREWTEACASNVLMRSGRKKRVRTHLQPYCSGEVPDEIGRDLVVLRELAGLLRELEALRPQFRGIERLWKGPNTDPAHVAGMVKWAGDLQDAVDAFQIDGVPSEHLLAHVAGHLTHDISRFRPGGQVRRAFDTMHQAFPAMHQGLA